MRRCCFIYASLSEETLPVEHAKGMAWATSFTRQADAAHWPWLNRTWVFLPSPTLSSFSFLLPLLFPLPLLLLFPLLIKNNFTYVTQAYVPWFFVSPQQRFGVMDIKAPSVFHSSQALDRLCYSS